MKPDEPKVQKPIIYAKGKNFDQPPRKVRLVIDQVRGKSVDAVLKALKFEKKKAAKGIAKVIGSAVSNAVNNSGMDRAKLYIDEARVDEGIVRKKPYYRAKGGFDMVSKRYSHIVIGVKEKEEVS